MAPLLHSLLRLTAYQSPFLRTLLPSIGLAYGIQAAVAVPSILATTERFYDLSGSLTYISCVALSLYLPTLRARAAAAGAKGVGAVAGLGAGQTAWPSLLGSLMGRGGVNVWNWRQVVLSAAVVIWATRRTYHHDQIHLLAIRLSRSVLTVNSSWNISLPPYHQ